MVKISACVIAKNEADNIARCLQSVQDVVDEMIVVDTGSSDDTVKIAAAMGAKSFHFAWIDDFSAARNHALAQAQGHWIVFLDADEYIVAEKAPNLRPLLDKIHGNRKVDVLTCTMEHTEGFGGPLKARDRTVRLFRNSPAIRYRGRIHEAIFKHDHLARSMHIADTALVIRHTGYAKETLAEKIERNHLLLEESLRDGSADGLTYYYLSHSYWVKGQFDQAVEFARKAIDNGLVLSSIFAHRVYVILIESMLKLDSCREEEVHAFVAEARQKFPHHPEVLEAHGLYLKKFGHYTQALKTLLQSLAADECYNDSKLANEFLCRLPDVHTNIAELYCLMNDSVKALDHYVLALKSRKDDAQALTGLITLIRTQKAADIACLLNSLYDLHAAKDVGFLLYRLAVLHERKVFAYYEKIWAERFHRQEFTAMKLLLNGHYAQALPLLAAACRQTGDKERQIMLAVAALLDGKLPDADALGGALDPAYRRIIAAFLRPADDGLLPLEDFPAYMQLAKVLLYYTDDDQLKRLLAVGTGFAVDDAPAQLAAVLVQHAKYRPALYLYRCQIGRTGSGPAGETAFQAGVCCYKTKGYETAAALFTQAVTAGFTGCEVHDYLAWCRQRLSPMQDI